MLLLLLLVVAVAEGEDGVGCCDVAHGGRPGLLLHVASSECGQVVLVGVASGRGSLPLDVVVLRPGHGPVDRSILQLESSEQVHDVQMFFMALGWDVSREVVGALLRDCAAAAPFIRRLVRLRGGPRHVVYTAAAVTGVPRAADANPLCWCGNRCKINTDWAPTVFCDAQCGGAAAADVLLLLHYCHQGLSGGRTRDPSCSVKTPTPTQPISS